MKSIIGTAADAGRFRTPLSALTVASLTDALCAAGPYTVFAPTGEASKRLAPCELEALLKDVKQLTVVLDSDVGAGTLLANTILPGRIKTVEGSRLVASLHSSSNFTSGAKFVQANIATSNGVIHAIDPVNMPKSAHLAAVA